MQNKFALIAKASKTKDNSVVFINTDQAHKIINKNSIMKKMEE